MLPQARPSCEKRGSKQKNSTFGCEMCIAGKALRILRARRRASAEAPAAPEPAPVTAACRRSAASHDSKSGKEWSLATLPDTTRHAGVGLPNRRSAVRLLSHLPSRKLYSFGLRLHGAQPVFRALDPDGSSAHCISRPLRPQRREQELALAQTPSHNQIVYAMASASAQADFFSDQVDSASHNRDQEAQHGDDCHAHQCNSKRVPDESVAWRISRQRRRGSRN